MSSYVPSLHAPNPPQLECVQAIDCTNEKANPQIRQIAKEVSGEEVRKCRVVSGKSFRGRVEQLDKSDYSDI